MCNSCERVFDESILLKDNAMLKVRPELFYEWDFEKNDELGLDVYKVTKGMNKKVYWKCKTCKSSFFKDINSRTNKNGNCPYCAGYKVNHTNSLASLKPDIAKEWHPTLNDGLTPHDVTCGTDKKVWWLGKCGHKWKASIGNRVGKGYKCPICNGKQVLVGFNDMWTTNPSLSSLLVDPENGYKYTQNSNKKVNWKCPNCGEIIKDKSINAINHDGLSCPHCSDGKSLPEKIMYNTLKALNLNFKWEKVFEWAKNKRYDFYLPYYNMIIEVHGEQHYKDSTRGRSLKEEQENDKLKKELAIKNGIEHYITIDARHSDIDYIKEKIISSKLNSLFDINKVDWNRIYSDSIKTLINPVCELWNKSQLSTSDISNIMNIDRHTVKKYLTMGSKLNLCNYSNKDSIKNGHLKLNKPVVQMSLSGIKINEFKSIKDALLALCLGVSSCIGQCCRGKQKTAYGYKWLYKEDYDKLIHNKEAI